MKNIVVMKSNNLQDTNLLLFTEMFPFGLNSEIAFLSNEIKYLISSFKSVTIVPQKNATIENVQSKPYNIDASLSDQLAHRNKVKYVLLAIFCIKFYHELFSKSLSFWDTNRIKRLIYYTARYKISKKWFLKYASDNNLSNVPLLIYTFWNNEITTALVSSTDSLNNVKVVSRAHGHDFNEDFWGYIPFLKFNVCHLDKLILVSQSALIHMSTKYPECIDKMVLANLGVTSASKISQPSNDGILRVVSCSYLKKPKRVDLIIKSLAEYSKINNQPLSWTHFGDGDQYQQISEYSSQFSSELFCCQLKGFVSNEEILHYYENNPVDFFISLTESEGGVPVSIQEAQARGIPVLATNVGGIPDIINDQTGQLIVDNPTVKDVVIAINSLVTNKQKFELIRRNSLQNWQQQFDQTKAYSKFIEILNNVVKL